jgi:tagaturonate reductase
VEGEQYHLFVIEGAEGVQKKFPADSIGLNVIFTNDIKRYKTIKVRILNGAHTCLVPVGYLYGIDTVRESVENETVLNFLKDAISKEICPTLDFEEVELTKYSNDVLDRFKNPFLKHELMSISLNSVSKYKTRVLPSVLEFIKRKNKLPTHLLISLAALIAFYKGDRNGIIINLQDNSDVLNFFKDLWSSTSDTEVISNKVLSNTYFWGVDLTQFEGLQNEVSNHLNNILSKGMKTYLDEFVN